MKLGSAFSDNISYSKHKRTLLTSDNLRGWGARTTSIYTILIVSFFALVTRLFHLTIVQGEEHRILSQENRMQTAIIYAPRGVFYDRKNEPLVENIPSVRVANFCDGDICKTRIFWEEEWSKREDRETYLIERDYFRKYTNPYATAHILGYLSEISGEETANPYYLYQDYHAGDRLGRMGLEAILEEKIRGTNGKELIEVDSKHKKLRTLGTVDAIPGVDIVLSLDKELQQVAYEAMGEYPGAVVVSKPQTGEILALVSTPSFDPNKIHSGIEAKQFAQILESPDRPLFNKAISGVYPPGSLFKIVSSVAALEEKAVTRSTLVEDTGILRIGEFSFGNWYFLQYGQTEGNVDILRALARSNDIYFYKLGEAVGITKMAQWGRRFGLGTKTGIELSSEAEGVMPDAQWRKKIRNSEWYLGDTYHVAIGQGDLQTTPLQVNQWASIIASNGLKCRPTLMKVDNEDSKIECEDLKISESTLKLVTEGMRRACYQGEDIGYQGTGWPFFDFSVIKEEFSESGGNGKKIKVPVACKTGTAELGDSAESTHAWFSAFAPIPDSEFFVASDDMVTGTPEIAVTVLVEKGGEGSSVAGPVAKKIMEEWFRR